MPQALVVIGGSFIVHVDEAIRCSLAIVYMLDGFDLEQLTVFTTRFDTQSYPFETPVDSSLSA